MPNYTNPAARLHAVLSLFMEQQESGQAIQTVWAGTLGVSETQVPVELCRLAGLVPQIVETVHLGADEHQVDNVDYWSPRWAAVLTTSAQSGANATGFLKEDMLRNLGMTASYLSLVAPEGVIPDDEQLESLRGQVASLLEEARAADKLPLQLRTVLVRRLHDISYALDHVLVVGPDGVQAAVERLMCSLAASDTDGSDADGPDGILTRVRAAAGVVYGAFLFGPTAYQAIEGWGNIGQRMLGM
ncbi:hypothetical protein AB0G48_03890 [Streptomyces rubiginosohelvolus]|uniref:hypothetical protein n=1 Tax=Streptomyces rubiginosohelvolus TaxID=67362 RepID=UPI0033D5C702